MRSNLAPSSLRALVRWWGCSVVLLLLFVTLAAAVKHTTLLTQANHAVLQFFIHRHTALGDIIFIAVSTICEAPYTYIVGSAVLLWFAYYRHWLLITHTLVTMMAAYKLSPMLKNYFDIIRPSDGIVNLGYAYPSGHTFWAGVAFGFLSLIFTHHLQGKKRYLYLALWNMPVVLVGVSRLYLSVHWLTDVIGGALIAWALNCASFPFYTFYTQHAIRINRYCFALVVSAVLIALMVLMENFALKSAYYTHILKTLLAQ